MVTRSPAVGEPVRLSDSKLATVIASAYGLRLVRQEYATGNVFYSLEHRTVDSCGYEAWREIAVVERRYPDGLSEALRTMADALDSDVEGYTR